MRIKALVVTTFLGISLYLWYPMLQLTNTSEILEEPVLVPDFTAMLLHQELFDQNGNLKQEVFSQKMEHFAELSLTYFEGPEFIIYQNDKPYWRLSAQIGSMQDGRLILDKNVVMYQLTDNELVTTIETEYLEINLNTQVVTTDKAIIIKGRRSTIEGQGLKADLKAGKVKLTQHVRTILKGNKS